MLTIISKKLTTLVKNNLHLKIKTIILKSAKSNYIPFLGFSIFVISKESKKITYSQKQNAIIKMRNQIKVRKINFYKKYINYIEKSTKLKRTQEIVGLGQYLKRDCLSVKKVNTISKIEIKKLILKMIINWIENIKMRLPYILILKKKTLDERNWIKYLQKNNQYILNKYIKKYVVGLKKISLLPKKVKKKT